MNYLFPLESQDPTPFPAENGLPHPDNNAGEEKVGGIKKDHCQIFKTSAIHGMTDLVPQEASDLQQQFPSENCPPQPDFKSELVITPRMELSIRHIVREQLASIGLSKLPASAVAVLASKLAAQARSQAAHSITPRAAARALLSAACVLKTGSHRAPTVAKNLSPRGIEVVRPINNF